MTKCLIALGGNLGISASVFDEALQVLESPLIQVLSRSRSFRTAALGEHAGEEFLNAAATLKTELSAQELLRALHQVEQNFGRVRTIHWGPRSLDLDLILFGEDALSSPDLVVPHPACWYRQFVLNPAAEIASEMRHPLLGESVGQMNSRLADRPLRLALVGGSSVVMPTDVQRELLSLQNEVEWVTKPSESGSGRDVFATIRFDAVQTGCSEWSQPRNQEHRCLVVEADFVQDAVREVRLIFSAIAGH